MADSDDEYGSVYKQTCSSIFCCESINICKRDYVTPLSKEKRLEYLIDGYVRELSSDKRDTSIHDILPLFRAHVGDPDAFNDYTFDDKLMTLTERGLNCCGYNTFWGRIYLLLSAPPLAVMYPLIIKLVLDIVALSVADSNDTETTGFKTIDSTTWLRVGAISDTIISVLFVVMSFVMRGREYGEW